MSVWDRARQLISAAGRLRRLPRRLIAGLSRLGAGTAVAPSDRAVGPLVKFAITFTYRSPDRGTGTSEVLEVALPPDLASAVRDGRTFAPAPDGSASTVDGEIGRWLRDTYYDGRGFVRVFGVEQRALEPPPEPRLSLPRALPELRADPERAAIRALRDAPLRGKKWYGFLTLDLDEVPPTPLAIASWAKKAGLRRRFEWRASAGGRGSHVRFTIREGVTPRLGFALRRALGDDPARVAIDATRWAYSGRSAIRGVLFDRKDGGVAGPWRSVRGAAMRTRSGRTGTPRTTVGRRSSSAPRARARPRKRSSIAGATSRRSRGTNAPSSRSSRKPSRRRKTGDRAREQNRRDTRRVGR